jgi:hypothetical protein
MGYWAVIVASIAQLATLALARGDLKLAFARGQSCIAEARAAGDRSLIAAAIVTNARLQLEAGQFERGTRLLAAESAWRETVGGRRTVSIWTWPAPTADAARAMLGEAAFTRAWTAGQLMSLESAAQEALAH